MTWTPPTGALPPTGYGKSQYEDAAYWQSAGPGIPRLASRSPCSTRSTPNAGTTILLRATGQRSRHYTPPAQSQGKEAGRINRADYGASIAGGSQAIWAPCSEVGPVARKSSSWARTVATKDKLFPRPATSWMDKQTRWTKSSLTQSQHAALRN